MNFGTTVTSVTPEVELVYAVIQRAAEDYRLYKQQQSQVGNHESAMITREMNKIRKYLSSDCGDIGVTILERLEAE